MQDHTVVSRLTGMTVVERTLDSEGTITAACVVVATVTEGITVSAEIGVVDGVKATSNPVGEVLTTVSDLEGTSRLLSSCLASLTTLTDTDGCLTQKEENSSTNVVLGKEKKTMVI